MTTIAKEILTNEGFSAFYKGTTSPLAGISLIVCIQFATNEVMKRFFVNVNERARKENIYALTLPQLYISGAVGGGLSALVACPVEHFRIRMQMQKKGENVYRSPADAAKKIYS